MEQHYNILRNLYGFLSRFSIPFLYLFVVLACFSPQQSQAKEFVDDLTTDFYAGSEDNIIIRQNLKGSLQLAPYSILGNWTSINAPSSGTIYQSSSVVYNGKIYITGGYGSSDSASLSGGTNDNALNKIWYSTILSDGSAEEWKEAEEASRLPQPTYGHASAVINGRLYIMGGSSTQDKTPISSVYWAQIIGHDGTIKAHYKSNTWTAVAALPRPLYNTVATTYEGRIYVTGGIDLSNTAQNVVYYANVQPNGDIADWNTATAQLPTSLAGHTMVQSNGFIYVIGGSNTGEQFSSTATVYLGSIDPVTGDVISWVNATTLPSPLYGASAAVSAGKIWVSGGIVSGTAKSTVYAARIDRNTGLIPTVGQRDTWTRTTDLPTTLYHHNMVAFNGHLFVLGGFNSSGSQKKVYTSTLITNKTNITKWVPTTPLFQSSYGAGSLETWTGHTAELRVPLDDDSSGLGSGAPKVFVIGGGVNTFNAYADGLGFGSPQAYSTIYNSEVDSNGSLKTWEAPESGGNFPMSTIMHTSTICNGALYIIGGANSKNANVWAGAGSRSVTANYQYPNSIGEATVWYEQVQSGSSSGSGLGTIERTEPIPIFDPAMTTGTVPTYTPNTATPIYQPLIRASAVSHNGYLYVLGGISRTNIGWVGNNPTGSQRYFEDRVWYCRPNPGGTINSTGIDAGTGNLIPGPGAWNLSSEALSASASAPTLTQLYDMAVCVANSRIYIFGGRDSTGTPRNNVYFAQINADGTLMPWVEQAAAMPMALAEHQVIYTAGRFYIIGGEDTAGNATNRVYYCTPDPVTGIIPVAPNPGFWEESNTYLEYSVAGHKCVSSNGYIYLVGGRYSPIDPHTSSAYMTNISDMYHTQDIVYAWAGNFERYVDLDSDQMVEFLNWESNANNETIQVKARYALENSPWSDWVPVQDVGPFVVNQFVRYIHYKVHMETLTNDASSGSANTPEVSRVFIDYAASKRMDNDSFQINHNKFDPQVETLTITYKTRDHSVDGVTLRVYNLEGELIRSEQIDIAAGTMLPATGSWIWDGTNDNAELVANGVYIIQYNSGNTHKIRKVIAFKQ